MNSLYKKIALVCLVSLTANQAAQAFQFSDILGWFKSNQKKSVACVALLAAIVGALYRVKYTKVAARVAQGRARIAAENGIFAEYPIRGGGTCIYRKPAHERVGRVDINIAGEFRREQTREALCKMLNDYRHPVRLNWDSHNEETDNLLQRVSYRS